MSCKMTKKPVPGTFCRGRRAALIFLAASFLALTGCQTLLMAPIYMMKGTDADPEFKKEIKEIPKGSKIVVICRSPYLNLFGADNPSQTLSLRLTKNLAENIDKKKKIEWIPFEKVEAMFDESSFANESYEKMGAKLGADYVVGVDVDSFDIHHSTQFYQGKTKVNVRLVKVEDGEVVFNKSLPQYTYPPNAPYSVNDITQDGFQEIFIAKVAGEIGCLFYPYNPHDKYALDSDVARLR